MKRLIPDSECVQSKCARNTTGCYGECEMRRSPAMYGLPTPGVYTVSAASPVQGAASAAVCTCLGQCDKCRGAASASVEERDSHRGGNSYEASMLRNLLARIHGDGGHYLEAHGLDKTLEDADQLVAAWRAERAQAAQPSGAVAGYKPGSWFDAHTLDEMQEFYLSRLPAIREAAKEHGYAIGLHGSQRRDLDLMAMQWRDGASDKDTLAHAIAVAACGLTRDGAFQWEAKPSGRFAVSLPICWTDHSNPDFDKPSMGHIDLSVIDIATPAPEQEAAQVGRAVINCFTVEGGHTVRRDARVGGGHVWLLHSSKGHLVRALDPNEQRFVDGALAAPVAQEAEQPQGTGPSTTACDDQYRSAHVCGLQGFGAAGDECLGCVTAKGGAA